MPASSPPITDPRQLSEFLARGGRPPEQHGIGVEHEKIAVLGDGKAPAHEGEIGALLDGLAALGWAPVREGETVIGLSGGEGNVSLEPGGQFEYSDRLRPSAREAAAALDAHLAQLAPLVEELGLTWLACGFRPLGRLDEVPWMPKRRYRVMREYLPTRGRLAHEMMKRTATVQVNVDWEDQADCAARLKVAAGVSPLVTALWACSSLVDGRATGFQCYRSAVWQETDPDRCGLPAFYFADDAGENLFARYAQWALDVPMFFVYRDGEYRPARGATFRRFLAEGLEGETATMADWELHLSTLFPIVRLRPHIEIRSADAGSLGMVKALPALMRGLLDDGEARRAAWDLVAGWSHSRRMDLKRQVPRAGLQARVDGAPILGRCRELVAVARAGLARLGDDVELLGPVEEVAATGRTQADGLLEAHRQAAGDVPRLIRSLDLSSRR